MIYIARENYPNILDAIRFHYVKLEIPEGEIPIALSLNINQVYLDRLESFIKDEIDLPEFYAFASGHSKEHVTRRVGYPMANNAFRFILDAIEGKNHDEGPRITAELKLPTPIEPSISS